MDIAIVGGGATGVSLIDAILRYTGLNGSSVNLTLYEPNKRIGPGRAYQSDHECALLNRQAKFMSIRAEEPTHFVDWVRKEHGTMKSMQEFLPRNLFGDYLSFCFSEQVAEARKRNTPIMVIRENATSIDIDYTHQRVIIGLSHGVTRTFDAAILCIGTAEPVDVYGMNGNLYYVAASYPIWITCKEIGSEESVGVLGSSLTAIDIALGLHSQGHTGQISFFSRRGFLPAVRQPHHDFTLHYFTEHHIRTLINNDNGLTIKSLFNLIKDEFVAQGIDPQSVVDEFSLMKLPLKRLQWHFAQTQSGSAWQQLLIKLVNDFVELIWESLNETDKCQFLRKYHSLFMSICNPMPPETARIMALMMEKGQLKVHSGVKTVQPRTGGGFTILCTSGHYDVDRLINASRAETGGVGSSGKPLVNCMINADIAQPHPHGGVRIEHETLCILRRNGLPNHNLFALGQLACGDLYYTSSLARITHQIERMVPHLLAPISLH